MEQTKSELELLIESIHADQKAISALEDNIAANTLSKKSIEATLNEKKQKLLSMLTSDEAVRTGDLVAQRFHTPNIGYTKDSDVLNWLKENFDGKFVKTKVTESLDKVPLKKELKTNVTLQEGLKDYILTGTTDYVVVTTESNYEKMLEHMKEGK